MTVRRAYKSDAFEAIHSAVTGMMEAGRIEKQTMRRFDETCLVSPDPMPPEAIKAQRERNNVSQPVFARYLNISPSTVQKWENGSKRPSGPALKLRAIVEKHGIGMLG